MCKNKTESPCFWAASLPCFLKIVPGNHKISKNNNMWLARCRNRAPMKTTPTTILASRCVGIKLKVVEEVVLLGAGIVCLLTRMAHTNDPRLPMNTPLSSSQILIKEIWFPWSYSYAWPLVPCMYLSGDQIKTDDNWWQQHWPLGLKLYSSESKTLIFRKSWLFCRKSRSLISTFNKKGMDLSCQ